MKLNIPLRHACGKKRHYTLHAAEQHRDQLAAVERRHKPSSPPLNVYHCSQCNPYHVGPTS